MSFSATGRLLDIEHLIRAAVLMTKVDEAASYGKLTMNALERLENRLEATSLPSLGAKSTSENLSDIASSLSRIESILCSGNSPTPSHGSCSGHGLQFSGGGSPCSAGPLNGSPSQIGRQPSPPLPAKPLPSQDTPVAGFVGYGPLISRRRIICSCCAPPAIFDSAQELKLHEENLPFACPGCSRRHKTRAEIEDHMYSWHHERWSWSCSNMTSWQATYFIMDQNRPSDACGYCGIIFARSGPGVLTQDDWRIRFEHIQGVHHFQDCDNKERFLAPAQFRNHLRSCHNAMDGEWMYHLGDISMLTDWAIEASLGPSQKAILRTHKRYSVGPLIGNFSQDSERLPEFFDMKDDLMQKYGGLLVCPSTDLLDCPKELTQYIRLYRTVEKQDSNKQALEVFSRSANLSANQKVHKNLLEAESAVKHGLTALLLDLEQARNACWAQGFDLDIIDELMGSCETFEDSKKNVLKSKEDNEKCENLTEIWNEILGKKGARVWSTKNDRINAWLLQNMAASPQESKHHRSYLKHGETLDEKQWARLVLKFWLIDEAAVPVETILTWPNSTNGAVDSDGLCHSSRVLLGALPVRKRRDFDSDAASLESEDRESGRNYALDISNKVHYNLCLHYTFSSVIFRKTLIYPSSLFLVYLSLLRI